MSKDDCGEMGGSSAALRRRVVVRGDGEEHFDANLVSIRLTMLFLRAAQQTTR
jgi:hypothetical protein